MAKLIINQLDRDVGFPKYGSEAVIVRFERPLHNRITVYSLTRIPTCYGVVFHQCLKAAF